MNDKKEDEIYCPECAKPVKKEAVVCPHCGVQIKELKTQTIPAEKSKGAAVVLALLFGFWAWLYTFGKNGVKFIIAAVFAIFYIILPVDPFGWALIIPIGLWIWALVDNAAKPASFYENYYKKEDTGQVEKQDQKDKN